LAVALEDLVGDVRRRGDEIEPAVALDALLDDLTMKHAQKAAAEAETEPFRIFRLIGKTAVVELELAEGFAEVLELVVVDRIQPREHHRLRLFVAGERL